MGRCRIQSVFDAIYPHAEISEADEYAARVVFAYCIGDKTALFVADAAKPEVFWLDVLSPGFFIRYETLQFLFLYSAFCGAKFVAAHYRDLKVRRYLLNAGMQDLGDELMAIKTEVK